MNQRRDQPKSTATILLAIENMSRFALPAARFRSASRTNSANLACVHTRHVRQARKKMQPRLQNPSPGQREESSFCVLSRWALSLSLFRPFTSRPPPLLAFLTVSFMSPRLNVRRIKYSRLNISLSSRRSPIYFFYYHSRFTYLCVFICTSPYFVSFISTRRIFPFTNALYLRLTDDNELSSIDIFI